MRRREFMAFVAGATAAWPLAAHAQQRQTRRIGILMSIARDSTTEDRITAFQEELKKLGWTVGDNVQIDVRWGAGDLDNIRKYASELLARSADVILANGETPAQELKRATRTTPIVFVLLVDPVGVGLVDSLAQPGGNITGFTSFEYSLGGKWLELLKEIAPTVKRIAVLRTSVESAGLGQYGVIQAAAQSFGMELRPIEISNVGEIERGIGEFAGAPNGGLVVTTSRFSIINRKLIIDLAARHRLPAVYPFPSYVTDGGLIAYGPDAIDQYKRAAGYVDRILKGEKPVDLPVQAPTKYELAINLKTAKALGLTIPQSLLARADEMIE